jgi:Arc/MetJ-type ribon-helix-helix transcriptional regulator
MANELSSASESFIQQQVAIGAYRDRVDAIEAGIGLLRQRQELLDHIDEGRRQLEEGDFIELDREGLRLFFESLKERARRAANAK